MSLPRRILACTDFSPAGNSAVAYAADLARALGAELLIAHLFDGLPVMQRELLREPANGEIATRREHGLEQLHALTRPLAPGLAMRCICEHADAHREIPQFAAREGADLIVVGRYGRGGFARFFMGSVADSVMRNSSVPVLAVGESACVGARATDTRLTSRT